MHATPKIVVVDDDQMVRSFIVDALTAFLPVDISAFAAGPAAWEHIEKNRIDMLISDINMEGFDGLDLLRRVRRDFQVVKCIIISGNQAKEREALSMGADAFMAKPFGIQELLKKVKCLASLDHSQV